MTRVKGILSYHPEPTSFNSTVLRYGAAAPWPFGQPLDRLGVRKPAER